MPKMLKTQQDPHILKGSFIASTPKVSDPFLLKTTRGVGRSD